MGFQRLFKRVKGKIEREEGEREFHIGSTPSAA